MTAPLILAFSFLWMLFIILEISEKRSSTGTKVGLMATLVAMLAVAAIAH